MVILPSEDSQDQTPEGKTATILGQWDSVVSSINKLSAAIKWLRSATGTDLQKLESMPLRVDAGLGVAPSELGDDDCGSAWDGLILLNSHISDIARSQDGLQASVGAALNSVDEKIDNAPEVHQRAVNQKVEKLAGELQVALNGLVDFVKLLSVEQEKLTESVLTGQNGTLGSGSAELNSLKVQVKVLEARIPSTASGRLGGELFQSRVDVILFVENFVPSNAFHLFHDVVTPMESLSTYHVERRDVLQEWYQLAKVELMKPLPDTWLHSDWSCPLFLVELRREHR